MRVSLTLSGPVIRLLLAILGLAALAACGMPGDAMSVVKVGVIAPFEGLGRPLGYAILPEVQKAVAAANASGALGRYRVAVVALNDDLDPEVAASQARALVQDGAVLAVLGPFGQEAAAAAGEVLSQAGLPALVAAPYDSETGGVISLCPPVDQIAGALRAASLVLYGGVESPCAVETACGATPVDNRPAPPFVFFPGDAEAAAEELLRRRSEGWDGTLLVGPDALRTWFVQRAGTAAEGTRGLGCSLETETAAGGNGSAELRLARSGIEALLQAVAADIRVHGRPSRPGVADALARQTLIPSLQWQKVQDGSWQPLTGSDAAPAQPP